MLTRKSGILALVIGATVLGACEQKAPIVNIPSNPLPTTVTIAGAPTSPIKKGATVQLIAVVANNANQAVTWSVASGSNVASVSTSGLVTALQPGTAVIKAVSVADPTAQSAVSIQVADTATGGGGTTVGQPSITIQSVTTNAGGLNAPVNPANVAGPIDVTLNVDIPAGVVASAVRTTLDGTEVCRQNFSASGSADAAVEASQVPQTIVCSINTAAFNATTGVATFPNGVHTLKAEVLNAAGTSIASATYQPLTFNNVDVVNATLTTTKGPAADGNGLSWRGGDVTVSLLPTIYSGTTNNVSSLTVTLTGSAGAAIEGTAGAANADFSAACSPYPANRVGVCAPGAVTMTDNDATNGFSVTFPAATRWAKGGAGNIEDPNVQVTINGLTGAGQNFAGNYNVRMNSAPVTTFVAGGVPVFNAANLLRLDNLAPRFTLLDITPATLACAPSTACYVNGAFQFTADGGSTLATTVDLGVDRQTTTFAAGTAAGSLTTVTNGGQLPETVVAQTNLLAATTVDALQNSRTAYATNVATCTDASSTSVAASNLYGAAGCGGVANVQKFGVDLTPPTIGYVAAPANNSAKLGNVAADGTYTFNFSDAGVGPSGFPANPVFVKVEQITAAGTTCYNQAGTATVSCSTNGGFVAGAGNVLLPPGAAPFTQAYYRVTAYSQDQAGNQSAQTSRVVLIDRTSPVVGGIVAPSLIAGGSNPTFTASTTDNLDLGDVTAALDYGAATYVLGYPSQTIGTYGFDVFTTSSNVGYTVNNIINTLEGTAVGGRPNGAVSNLDQIEFDVRDVQGVTNAVVCVAPGVVTGCAFTQQNIVANVTLDGKTWAGTPINSVFASANPAHGNFTQNAPSNATVCNKPSACVAASKTSTTLSAQVTGPNTTFGDPFQRVLFFVQDNNGRYQLIGQGSVSITDNTVTSTRTITYTITWVPDTGLANAAAPGTAHNIIAIGTDAAGHGLVTNVQVVNLTTT